MRPAQRLDIVVRVPVGIVKHDRVCGGEVDAEAARPGREEEDELLLGGGAQVAVEAIDAQLPLRGAHVAVEPLEAVAARQQVVLEDVEHLGHLAEDEHPVVVGLELGQQQLEQLHLAAALDELGQLGCGEVGVGLVALDEPRVVGALLQLHHDVGEAALLVRPLALEDLEVLGEHGLVEHALLLTELDAHHELLLLRDEVAQHVSLHPAQDVRRQHAVQLADLVLVVEGLEGSLEGLERCELLGLQEVQQRPQLLEIVLQRRASEQQPEGGAQGLQRLE